MKSKEVRRHFPWWLYLILAIAVYLLLKYILPSTERLSPKMQGLAELLAPIVTIIFLVLAANGLYRSSPAASPDDDQNPQDEQS